VLAGIARLVFFYRAAAGMDTANVHSIALQKLTLLTDHTGPDVAGKSQRCFSLDIRDFFLHSVFEPSLISHITVNTAPTIYWSLVEASLAVVSACLPTIRPLFHGMSPESVIRSIRSRISLHSIHSRGSKDSKGSKGSKYVKPTEDQASTSSQVGFRNHEEGPDVDSSFDVYGAGQNRNQLQTQVKGIELGEIPQAHLEGVPDNRIKVLNTIQQNDENV